MKHTFLTYLFVLCAGAASSLPAWAGDVVVIGNKGNPNAVDKAFVIKVYTGQTKTWADGGPVFAIDQGVDSAIRADFYSSILGKSSANMKAVWAQNIFSGKGLPPKIVDPDTEVKRTVGANQNAIGYIKASSVDDTVKVLVK